MKRPEILSPAGNMACLKAALLGGCDAVYLGGHMFGARAFSNNFTNEEITEAVKLAHSYGVKLYVTVNTLIYENEVEAFMKYINFLYMNDVDAVIVQDIGMMDLIRQTYPDFEVHASTQMHIHNLEGVKLVEKLGLTRAVLARETSIEEIAKIKKETNIELEIFVHGALCISYSGQCLMSSLIGGRSGNRGTCAGSCRQKYDVLDESGHKVNKLEYNLSTKDLNSLENIGKLIEIGVDSLKIEGRMKSPSYVYLVTKLYRQAVDSYIKTGKVSFDKKDIDNLKRTFNRMFTKGFLFNENNQDFINPYRPNHLGVPIGKVISVNKNEVTIKLTDELNINDGIRFIGKEDNGMLVTQIRRQGKKIDKARPNDVITLSCNKKVLNNSEVVKTTDYLLNKEIEALLDNDVRKISITGNLKAVLDKKMELTVSDGVNEITVENDEIISKALNRATSKEEIIKQLDKTGNTIFKFSNLSIDMTNDLFIPIKEINELRRKALDELLVLRQKIKRSYEVKEYRREVTPYTLERNTSIYIKTQEQYNQIKDKAFDKMYVDLNIYNDLKKDNRVVLKLPRVMHEFADYNAKMLVGELGGVNKYTNVDTDFSLNVVNSYSIALLNNLGVSRVTISYELTDEQIIDMIGSYKNRYHANPDLAIIVYAKEEIMVSKFNLLKYYNLSNKGYLKDRFNNLYKVTNEDNLMYIYNYKARIPSDINKYYEMGISEIRYNIVDDEDLRFI